MNRPRGHRSNGVLAFNSLGLILTPEIMDVIAFARDAYLPSQYIPTWLRQDPDAKLPCSKLVRSRALSGSVGVLRSLDYGFAYPETIPAWLTSFLPYMISLMAEACKPRYEILLLQFRTRSLKELRSAVEAQRRGENTLPTGSLILQILYLFRSDCTRSELVAAQAHAVILPWIESASDLDQKMTVHLLITAMFHDTEMACKAMRHTLLDFKHWLKRMLTEFWVYTESLLDPLPADVQEPMNHFIASDNGPVPTAATRLRRCLAMRDSHGALGMHPPDQHIVAHLKWAWAASRTLHDIGLLINRALNLIAQVDECSTMKHQSEVATDDSMSMARVHELEMRAAMTLTVLYNVRKYLHKGSCNGIDLREAPRIMFELQRVLKKNLEHVGQLGRRPCEERELLYWIIFTGAWHAQEIRVLRPHRTPNLTYHEPASPPLASSLLSSNSSIISNPSTNAHDVFEGAFFERHLSMLAVEMGLTSWPSARDVLKSRFIFSDEVARPHPSTWYEELTKKNYAAG